MRAQEFVVEYRQYPTREYEGVTFTMMEKDGQLIVKALNDFGLPMGHVVFGMDGRELDPKDLEVYEKYQGQGIARVMYDYIKSQGFTIIRSFDQTDAGRGFWDKHRGEDAYVWEAELDEANKLTLRDFVVTISPHALDQCYNRSVNSHMVDDILRNMSRVKHNIMGMEQGAAFILHNGLGTGLGVRRGAGNNLTLATVFKTGQDFVKGKHPTFRVDTYPDVKEQTLSEIESIPAYQYSGGKDALGDYNNINPSTLKMLPGNNRFAYSIEPQGYLTNIFIVDTSKSSTDAVAKLEVAKDDLPIKGNPVSVETITVDEDYRGQGLAKALYGIVLAIMKRPLVAGSAQTPGGKRNWLSLDNIPGVEVKGVVQLENRRLDATNAVPGSKLEKYIEKSIDQVMELGGQFLGKTKYATYWAFDVVPGTNQLEPYIKNSLSKIYGYDATTTLLARWTGK